MRHKDTELMVRIRNFIRRYYTEHGRMPSTTDIARAHRIARSTAYNYLVAMDKVEMIVYSGGRIQDEATDIISHEQETAAVLGSIPCGSPELEDENVECIVNLPKMIFGRGPFYLLHATGDSMTDEGIDEGDLLVIRRQNDASVGDIVVVIDESNDNTLKKYAGIDKQTGEAVLRYCNHEKYGDKEIRLKYFGCQGVLTHIIKQV